MFLQQLTPLLRSWPRLHLYFLPLRSQRVAQHSSSSIISRPKQGLEQLLFTPPKADPWKQQPSQAAGVWKSSGSSTTCKQQQSSSSALPDGAMKGPGLTAPARQCDKLLSVGNINPSRYRGPYCICYLITLLLQPLLIISLTKPVPPSESSHTGRPE